MSIGWTDSLASGSSEIDTQHKELFTGVNSLLGAIEKGATGREEISRIVGFLTEYVVFHFGTEEKYMDKFCYSSAVQHKAQHQQFVKSFLNVMCNHRNVSLAFDGIETDKEVDPLRIFNSPTQFKQRPLGSLEKNGEIPLSHEKNR